MSTSTEKFVIFVYFNNSTVLYFSVKFYVDGINLFFQKTLNI